MLVRYFEYPKDIDEYKKLDLLLQLKSGGVLFAPTDTVFGVLSLNKQHIYDIKKKPEGLPLQLLTTEEGSKLVFSKKVTQNRAFRYISQRFWPGPLSIIAETGFGVHECVRVPNNLFLLDLLRRLGKPLFASSLNEHGHAELWKSEEIKKFAEGLAFNISVVFQESAINRSSTIIRMDFENQAFVSLKIIREGMIAVDQILASLSPKFYIERCQDSVFEITPKAMAF